MSILESIFLGIIQGLTEFIPVSSSGHLGLIPQFFGITPPSTIYITFLHFGTLLSLIIFYRKLLKKYLITCIKLLRSRDNLNKEEKNDSKIMFNILLATIPAALLGVIFERFIAGFYDSPENKYTANLMTIAALIIVGVIFLFAHKIFRQKKFDLEKLSKKGALLIGFSQSFAFLRGVSRSGITLLSGQLVGLKRVSAAEFGFLMGIPITAATSIYGVYKLINLPAEELKQELVPALMGFSFAFIAGIIAIRFMISYLKSRGLQTFGIYRIILGVIALFLLL